MLESLDTPPGKADQFLWTDFVELRALIHPDRCFSRGDFQSLGGRAKDASVDRPFSEDENNDKSAYGRGAVIEKRWREIIDFSCIRTSDYGEAYPFNISDDGDTLELTLSERNSLGQRFYLSLLLASLLRHFPRKLMPEVGRYFEESCLLIFSKLMPEGARIKKTWAGGGAEAPYQGTLYEKMRQIAEDLRCPANFKARDFKRSDTGDGGIDLISWHPMADDRDGMPIAFAQCGCSTTDWTFKQLEASPTKHRRHFPVIHPWATYYFLPVDLRHPDGGWAYASDIAEAIIVDRLRMIRLAAQYGLHDQLPDLPVREEVMALSLC